MNKEQIKEVKELWLNPQNQTVFKKKDFVDVRFPFKIHNRITTIFCNSQLFEPKPDENRLLTDEEIKEIEKVPPEDYGAPPNWWLRANKRVAKAQDAKTTSIKDAECQKRVERIFEEIDNINAYIGSYEATINSKRAISLRGSGLYFDIDGFMKALKKQEGIE